MKNINNFTQWKKNGSVDVTITSAIMHQKHLAQSGRSMRSAVDIFNTLRIFTKEPIREQEIKLQCMNTHLYCSLLYIDKHQGTPLSQIYKGDPRPRIPPCVMASSAMGLKLGVFGFCRPHTQKQM